MKIIGLKYKINILGKNRNKKIFLFISLCLLILPLSSCIFEDFTDEININPTEPEYYISVNINSPGNFNSRSMTNNDGSSSDDENYDDITYGHPGESKIDNASIFFYNYRGTDYSQNELLCYFNLSEVKVGTQNSDGSYPLYAKISYNQIKSLFGKKIDVYIIANADTKAYETEYQLRHAKINSKTSRNNIVFNGYPSYYGIYLPEFFFSNYEQYQIDLTNVVIDEDDSNEIIIKDKLAQLFNEKYSDGSDIWSKWDISSTEQKQYNNKNLYKGPGTFWLERSGARIDYFLGPGKVAGTAQVFQLEGASKVIGVETGTTYVTSPVYLTFMGLQVFNYSKKQYIFRHVTEGTNTGGNSLKEEDSIVLGLEKGTVSGNYNWIYDTDWEYKYSAKTLGNFLIQDNDHFYSQPQDIPGLLALEDPDVSFTYVNGYSNFSFFNSQVKDPDSWYCPCLYIPENTVPSISKMTIPLAPGIIFRFAICKDDESVRNLSTVNRLGNPGEPLRIIMNDGSFQDLEYFDGVSNEKPSSYLWEGQYLNYIYLIEHNKVSNGNVNSSNGTIDTSLAPMQIGVVRNNIYQVKINSIKGLPDPEKPGLNLDVDMKILPWGVRSDEDITLK